MCRISGFDAITPKRAKVLILGSMPSIESLRQGFYYAHPSNRFWKMMHALYKMPTDTREEKIALLEENGIALWDVVASCQRQTSADAKIKDVIYNDIHAIVENNEIVKILCNGKKSYELLKRYDSNLQAIACPSTSSANAAWSLEKLIKFYGEELL